MVDDDDPIRGAYEAGGYRPASLRVVGGVDAKGRPPLELHPARLPDPQSIPPRQWLYGNMLLRGEVTVLVAPGGTGKSAYAIGVGVSLVVGRPLLAEHVFQPCRVAIVNLDESLEELDRRVAAFCIRHLIRRPEIAGGLFLDSGEGRGLTIAELGDDGFTVAYPDVEELIAQIQKHQIGVIIVDPFAESHTLEENSNPMMIKAAAAWRRVARATGCAVFLIHHVRKGEISSIDAARGAKAVTDSARVGTLMTPMAAQEAQDFGIEDDVRWQYIRVDNAKRNLSPAGRANWLHLESVDLGNTGVNPLYPAGDSVQAVVAWQPQSVWSGFSAVQLNVVLDRIAAGLKPGVMYSPDKRGASGRWVGQAVIGELDVDEDVAARIVSAWFKSGLLKRCTYDDKKEGHARAGVAVVDALRPTV